MKAIDRAATWTRWLEEVGFDIECETSEEFGGEYLLVRAEKGRSSVRFIVRMDTKYTRFITGSVGYCAAWNRTRKPSQMSSWVSSEVMMENYRMKQAVAS